MKPILLYIGQVVIASGILYGYYHFFLRNKKFHNYNRYYLLAVSVISICIPFFSIPVFFIRHESGPSALLQSLAVISPGSFEEMEIQDTITNRWKNLLTPDNLIGSIYLVFGFIVLSRFIIALVKIKQLMKKYPVEKMNKILFINTLEPGTPFSFFRLLFWNRKIALDTAGGQQIFRHELYHIRKKHSYDIIFIEMLTIIFWFNPFFHLIRRELKAIHEFLADQSAVLENEEWNYAELLLMQVLGSPNTRLTNPFFHNQIKRRIAMITSSQKTNYQYLRKLLVLPIAAMLVALFAFKYKAKVDSMPATAFIEPLTVVIDAGHGGQTGAVAEDGTYEGDLALALAQKVKALNRNDRIHILLTRDSKKELDLRKRSEFANAQNPDLFISIHLNNDEDRPTHKSGFDVFISKKNSTFTAENKILGTILLNYFSNIYPGEKKIQQQNEGIWVLDNSKCPSVLIECGYLSNKKDLAFIKETANQELVAQRILQSIEQYSIQKEMPDFNERKKQVADTIMPDIKIIKGSNGKVSGTIGGSDINGISSVQWTDKYGKMKESMAIISDENNLTVIPKELADIFKKKYGSLWDELLHSFPNTGIPPKMKETSSVNGKIFTEVEVDPTFPGGEHAWQSYLQKNLNANTPVDHNAPEGTYTVWVEFLVAKNGDVSDVKVLTSPGYGTEDEVVKLLENGHKWIPGRQNGQKVNAYKKQPVTFVVQEERQG